MFRTSRRCALGAALILACIAPLVAAPPQPATQGDSARPNFFNSVALAVPNTPYDAKWLHAWVGGPGPVVASHARSGAEPAALALLANVQRNANHRVSFRPDSLGPDTGGLWSRGRFMVARESADCEDDAIAKVRPLLALGFRPQDLYFVIGDDRNLMTRRALLVVRAHGKFWVLDSLSSAVVDADLFRDFDPIITLSADRKWMHGYAKGTHQRSFNPVHRRPLIAPGPKLAAILLEQDVSVAGRPGALRSSSPRTNRCEARIRPGLDQISMLGSK